MSGLDREVRQARARYIGALRRLASAMTAFERAQVPLEPAADGQLPLWTVAHHDVMAECAGAWAFVVDQRRAFEAAVREADHPVP
ncbi:MAG TPA: hypothetical protein VF163_10275 [Micromonosporaceae bacterium]